MVKIKHKKEEIATVARGIKFTFFVLLFLIKSHSTLALQLSTGTYERISSEGRINLLEIREDSSFYSKVVTGYDSFLHTYYLKYQGHYRITGDTLTLNYFAWSPPAELLVLEEKPLIRESIDAPATSLHINIKISGKNLDSINYKVNSYDSAIDIRRADIRVYNKMDSVTTNISIFGGKLNLALKNPNKIIIYTRKTYPLHIDLTPFIDKTVTLKCILFSYDGRYCNKPHIDKYLIKEKLPYKFTLSLIGTDGRNNDLVYRLK